MHNDALFRSVCCSPQLDFQKVRDSTWWQVCETENILTHLQNSITDHFKPVYSQLEKEAKKNTESLTNWQVVSYSVRRYVLGNYQRDVIPSYLQSSIDMLPDNRAASFFMQTLVVKHNHLTVSRALSRERPRNVLMDLDGKFLTDKVPRKLRQVVWSRSAHVKDWIGSHPDKADELMAWWRPTCSKNSRMSEHMHGGARRRRNHIRPSFSIYQWKFVKCFRFASENL